MIYVINDMNNQPLFIGALSRELCIVRGFSLGMGWEREKGLMGI